MKINIFRNPIRGEFTFLNLSYRYAFYDKEHIIEIAFLNFYLYIRWNDKTKETQKCLKRN